MRLRWKEIGAGVLALSLGNHLAAHHAISSYYDNQKRVTLKATVREVRFVNPHPLIMVDAPGGNGAAERWTLEMDNRWELAELGFHTDKLKPGDLIVVNAVLSRQQARAAYVRKLERPADGFVYEHHR